VDTGGVESQFGIRLAFGDFDADGKDDLAIGANTADFDDFAGDPDTDSDSGSVYVKFGDTQSNLIGSDKNHWLGAATNYGVRYDAEISDARGLLGVSVEFGDFDGDGFADLAMGGYLLDFGGTDSGSVYLIYGSTRPDLITVKNRDLSYATNYDLRFDGENQGGDSNFGINLGFGNFDGDEYADLAMGAYTADFTGTDMGSLYVVMGEDRGEGDALPPAAINDLVAVPAPSSVDITLQWTSPGENMNSKILYNSTFTIQYTTYPTFSDWDPNRYRDPPQNHQNQPYWPQWPNHLCHRHQNLQKPIESQIDFPPLPYPRIS